MITVIIIVIMIIRIMLAILKKSNETNLKQKPNQTPYLPHLSRPTSITSSDSPHWWRIPTPRYAFSRHGPPRPVKWETKIDTFEVCGFSSFSILVKIGSKMEGRTYMKVVHYFVSTLSHLQNFFEWSSVQLEVEMNSFRFLHISVESCHW